MSFSHSLLAAAYTPLKMARDAQGMLRPRSRDCLRILLYHDIAPSTQAKFEAHLRWIRRRWRFVSPGDFAAMVIGKAPVIGRNVLLTFDDGFSTDRSVADQVLNTLGIHAIFFVVSDFVECVGSLEARRFVAERIRPGGDAVGLPSHLRNMSWSDLERLLEQGHTIGAHTRSHPCLSNLHEEQQLEDEIVGGADSLSLRLGVPVEHFAFPFGGVDSFSALAHRIARRRFPLVYSGVRGPNAPRLPAGVLRRESVPLGAPRALVGAFLEGAADFHYRGQRRQLDAWALNKPTLGSHAPPESA